MRAPKKRQRPLADSAAIVVGVDGACIIADCGKDELYNWIRSGEVESFLDGRRRKIVVASIKDRIRRKLAVSKQFTRARHPGSHKPNPEMEEAPSG